MVDARVFGKTTKVEFDNGYICDVGKEKVTSHSVMRMHRFSLQEYHRMASADIFHDIRLELLYGCICDIIRSTPQQAYVTGVLFDELREFLPKRTWSIRTKAPLTLLSERAREGSEPEPSAAVVRGPTSNYRERHPSAADVGVVMEVDPGGLLGQLRYLKARLYSESGLPEYWYVNSEREQIEVFTSPRIGKHPHYQRSIIYAGADTVPVKIDGRKTGEIAIKQIWPKTVA